MSWFDLKLDKFSFKSVLDGSGQNELIDYGLFGRSFSDFHVCMYLGLILVFIASACLVSFVCRRVISNRSIHWWVVAVVSFVILAYIFYSVFLLWNVRLVDMPDWARRGEFGDSFGTINALFSGLAFSGVLLTLLFQRKDLSDTKRQMRNQAFESQFYSLLSHQQEIVKNFDLQDPDTNAVITQGRDCFKRWDRFIRYRYWHYAGVPDKKPNAHVLAYNEVAKEHGADWELYFRSLYLLFEAIRVSEHSDEQYFAFVVRSLLSSYELKLMFYHCLTPQGARFSFYVDRYSLFSDLDDSMIYDAGHLRFFSIKSYGENQAIISRRQ